MKEKINIFWFRRDLRSEDNVGFNEALKSGLKIIPIFIYDPTILEELPKEDARLTFIHQLLSQVNSELKKVETSLATYNDTPFNVFEKLISEFDITAVFTNHDYEPYAIQRDIQIKDLLENNKIAFQTFKDQVIFERNEIVKDDGLPYVVFTPYANKWKSKLKPEQIQSENIELQKSNFIQHNFPFLSLKDIGFKKSTIQPKSFDLSVLTLKNYAEHRDFPAVDSTTHLSPYLRFGAVSIRAVFAKAFQENNKKLVDELIWREFFMQILWHFPHTVTQSFKAQYDEIHWRNNEEEFTKWCEGNTGYPMVDAGMRELNATGNMHNRVRMVVAGFLCKHLLIDWRWGEAYFAEKLLDYEQSSNIGNWQWAAGSGVDAAPYFRIFNPTEQVKKFDKDLKYIKKWVPEVEEFSYPRPIVDHKEARERCLTTYKIALA
ncbi:MAG TPA: deoxyribodipyrimidine photo-lyase [Chitinophagales bacterium]|nr:deoxyribodipyrimidine photo-lyase [Chitinophagales bacterium]